ncbi:nuclear export factor GLE1 [Bacillus sp. SRB_336]|nr:nuclear export factor GLE1 [Bacillus sp. SRB_336]
MKTSLRRTLKTVTTGALAAAMLSLGAAAASAHVTVSPDDPAANGYTHLSFNVPNESVTAKTDKVVVTLPADAPFTSVSVRHLEGWTARVITSKLPKPVIIDGTTVTKAPSAVVWTADAAHEIGQNEYQTFALSVGKLPKAGTTITMPAVQTYTDGSTVEWNEAAVAGKAEPEHPAPSFVTTAEDAAAPVATAEVRLSNTGLSILALVLGAMGLLLGGAALGIVIAGRRKSAAK